MVGIYKITNQVNGKCYIGQSVDIHKRWINHRSVCNNPNDGAYDYHIYRAMRKYGINNFIFQVIEQCMVDDLNNREKYWIAYYDSYKNGYNSTAGGDHACIGKKITPDILIEIDGYLRESNLKIQQIADTFKVSYEMIQGINTGRHWHRDIDYPIRKKIEKKKNYCIDCGKEINANTIRCWECFCKTKSSSNKPDILTLLKLVSELPMVQIGKRYGVTDNAIRKWCVSYGIPKKKEDAIQYIKENNIIFDEG